jgi:hypothetical protein
LADGNPEARGRLLGLTAASIIESRDLFLDVQVARVARQMAAVYESEGMSWPYPDRILFLDALGRLDPVDGDPRLHHERWVEVKGGEAILGDEVATVKRKVSVEKFAAGWAPVTVQEYKRFAEAGDALERDFWLHMPSEKPPSREGLQPNNFQLQLRYPNRPVTSITLGNVLAFCAWLTAHRTGGKRVRLLTEAEWSLLCHRAERNRGEERRRHLSSGSIAVGASIDYGLGGIDPPGPIFEWCSAINLTVKEAGDSELRYFVAAHFEGETGYRRAWHNKSFAFQLNAEHLRIGFRCALSE